MTPLVLQHDSPDVPAAVEAALETSQTIIFPTDTVYGIGGNPWDDVVLAAVRALKTRPADQPFTLHLPNVSDVERYAVVAAHLLPTVRALLPGPYTLLLPARREAPASSVVNKVVGVRVPRHAFFASVMAALDRPLFGTSVNVHGEPPLVDPNEIIDRFGSIDLVILGPVGAQSSDIIDLTGAAPRAVRGTLPAWLRPPAAAPQP